ncbi:MAG: DEAD/DEAH box helicase [Muribaculaceae bacterium]|nr:DEAD/DEAH box helicase [Muribaculaceae bacterium]
MAKKIIDDFEYLDQFQDYTKYFLTCEENSENYTSEKCNSVFIKIFNTILFEHDENRKSKQVAYLVFWLNFIIELKNRRIEEPLLTTIITIIDKLDLQQLIGFTAPSLPMDFYAELNYETRKIFDNDMALTNAQLDMLFAIFERKNMIVSAPTSYGKTGVALKSLLVSLDKGYINNFLVILPTKSLINEYRKNINNFFSDRIDSIVVSEAPYVKPESNKSVFLFTQERFLIFNNNFPDFKFDYAVLDEVQDLINVVKSSDNERSVLLAKSISILAACEVPMSFFDAVYQRSVWFICQQIYFNGQSCRYR